VGNVVDGLYSSQGPRQRRRIFEITIDDLDPFRDHTAITCGSNQGGDVGARLYESRQKVASGIACGPRNEGGFCHLYRPCSQGRTA